MPKTTKRSKKFNISTAKSTKAHETANRKKGGGGGGSAAAPSSSSSSKAKATATTKTTTTAANRAVGKKKKAGGGDDGRKKRGRIANGDKDGMGGKARGGIVVGDVEEVDGGKNRKREEDDFLDAARLGKMDVDSFFEEAVSSGGFLGADDGSDDDGDEDDDEDDDKDSDEDEDGDGDSYASLGSEEEDVAESEARLRRQLDELSSKDPEFHRYLKDNESSLLEYGDGGEGDDGDDGDDAMEDDDDDDAGDVEDDGDDETEDGVDRTQSSEGGTKKTTARKETKKDPQRGGESKFLLTPRRLEQLERGAFGGPSSSSRTTATVRGLKRIVAAFGTACRLSDANRQDREEHGSDDDEEGDGGKGGGGKGGGEGGKKKRKEFQITSPAVFDRLMAICLVRCHEEFHRHLLSNGERDDDDDDSDGGSDDGDDDDGEGGGGGSKKGKPEKKGESTKKGKDDAFDENKPLHPKTLAKSPNWPALRPVIESFLKSALHLLSEAGKEAELLRFVLRALSRYVPYLAAYPRLARPALRTCVRLWSAPLDTSEGHNAVRLQAFLRVRQLAVTQPYPLVEDCLKSSYLGYARRAKFGTASNVSSVLPTLTFMGNCVVELYGLDYASAYQHAFVYIRQLALHLRSAMTKKTPESRAVVCCWQYVHCLKLWVAVLCASCGGGGGAGKLPGGGGPGGGGRDEEANLLRSLAYPLAEVILGVCRLAPVAQFVPLRLHCVRLLQQLAASTGTFVPTTSLLLGVLDHREVGMKPLRGDGKGKGGKKNKSAGGGATVRGLRLPLILKLPKEGTLRTLEQLDGVLKETFVLLNREMDLYRYSPGFPEFTFSILQRLRRFNKEIGNGQWRAYSKGTIELCEKYSAFAVAGRSTLADAPKDVRRLEALKPPNVPSMRERYESAVAKERRLEVATRPATKANDKKVRAYDDDDDDDDIVNETLDKRKRKGEEVGGGSDEDGKKEEQKSKKSTPRKKRKAVVNEADLKNVAALKEEDEVHEGVEWSDSESD